MFKQVLSRFRRKLVNLSGSNRSILLLRLSKEHGIDLNDLDYLLNKPSFNIIEGLLSKKNNIPLCDFIDSRNEKINLAGKLLQKLDRKDKFLSEESGTRDLFIGWPFIEGSFSDGSLIRCPLLLFSVELKLENNKWIIVHREGDLIQINKSFFLAWIHFNKVDLNIDLDTISFDLFSEDPIKFRTELYEFVKSTGLQVDYNSDLFINKLIPFQNYSLGDYSKEVSNGRLKLFNQGVLGFFPQAGSFLLPDYQSLIVTEQYPSFESFFLKPSKDSFKSVIKESDILTPLLIDSSQEDAIKMVKSGKSIVVQGPPGTGKSQLIANLTADYISKGKKVLIVCQKKAALDVVYNRLESIGAGAFAALTHDFKADRNRIYQQLADQIDNISDYKSETSKLNTVFLEREYLEACKKTDQLNSELQSFKDALFDEKECGYSVKELYLNCNIKLPVIHDAGAYFRNFPKENLKKLINKLSFIFPYAIKFDRSNYIFSQRVSFKNFGVADKNTILSLLKKIEEFNISFKKYELLFGLKTAEFKALDNKMELLVQLKNQIGDENFFRCLTIFNPQKISQKKAGKLKIKLKDIHVNYKRLAGKQRALAVPYIEIEGLLIQIKSAQESQHNFLSRIIWKHFSSKDKTLLSALSAHGLSPTLEGLTRFEELLNNLKEYENYISDLKKSDFDFGNSDSDEEFLTKINSFRNVLDFIELWNSNEVLQFPLSLKSVLKEDFNRSLTSLIQGIELAKGMYTLSRNYFLDHFLDHIFEISDFKVYYDSISSDFEELVQYDSEKSILNSNELCVLKDCLKYSQLYPESNPVQLIENSIKLSWIQWIEGKFPILSAVSTSKINMIENELEHSIKSGRKLSGEILLLKLKEQAYKNEEFNRLGNRTTFRDLRHQVGKKKKIWPLRKTMESFKEEIFCLVPCWLASPETVSAIFPLEQIFDLVIFDEASQCYIEKGIPSIARGQQVVIAGDSKQLQPNDIYQTRFEDNTDLPETEVESLLDIACRFYPQVMLTKHYRSKSLDLIEFSNKYFYKNKLQLLPDFQTFKEGYKGIEYHFIPNGIFQDRQNIAEAEHIVTLCLSLFKSNKSKQIGVITFNISQQNLIQDLLEQKLISAQISAPEGFIVKNIENIQGDEKDIIIFSIGYAPNSSGKMHHHFGSLNMEGGENRLNVAITRAREKVIVVTSIYPVQLNVEESAHPGPKLLKEYLAYALEVSKGRFVPSINSALNFTPDWFLKEKLKKQKIFIEDLPFADLTEKNESGGFEQLILTDDDKFHHMNVKESYYYLPEILKQKNWKFKRMYSRNFFLGK